MGTINILADMKEVKHVKAQVPLPDTSMILYYKFHICPHWGGFRSQAYIAYMCSGIYVD